MSSVESQTAFRIQDPAPLTPEAASKDDEEDGQGRVQSHGVVRRAALAETRKVLGQEVVL